MLGPRYLEVLIIYVLPGLIAWDGPAYCKTANGTDEYWLNRHLTTYNNQRKALAHGWQEDTYGALPPAKNMNKLMWDCALEQEAEDFLAKQNCDLLTGRKEGLEEPDKGYAYFIASPISLFHLTDEHFFSSVSHQSVRYMDGDEPLKQWANIMRANASKVGCANITCWLDNENINGVGRRVSGGHYVYLCLTDLMPSTWCEWKEIPDTMRMLMQDTHNMRRSTLALGQTADNTGTTLPAATNMNNLAWDCTLEKEAHDFLKSCPTEGYQRPDDRSPAQNFFRQTITANEPTYKDMNSKTVTAWWKQVRKVNGPGTSTYFRLEHNSTEIRSFTLMAWASSEKMGCSIAKCGNEWVEACRYYPPGNKVGAQMYMPGKACSQCDALGVGPCARDRGLCV